MKQKMYGRIGLTSKVLAAGCLVPLGLLLAGCNRNDSTPETTTTPAVAATDTNSSVDNSKINERDRGDMTLTPGDQGNSDADRQITRRVRQTLVSGTNDYSMIAKNVKIITANGKVTLRGPVNTQEEKTGIETIAKSVAGDGNVDDQLEVKTNP
jgi:hyperosmotically inducible protein